MSEIKTFHPVKACNDGLFNTTSGNIINLLAPAASEIDIHDISNALSHQCRFGGHVLRFYSVAQHSVLVAAMAPDYLKKEALLHDAAEAYLGDVIKPLKVLIGKQYEKLEREFTIAIFNRFNLIPGAYEESVKQYDIQALELEHEALQEGNPLPLLKEMNKLNLFEANSSFYSWEPQLANKVFLNFFKMYFR